MDTPTLSGLTSFDLYGFKSSLCHYRAKGNVSINIKLKFDVFL